MVFAICDTNIERCEYFHDMLNDYMNDHKINTKIYSFLNPNILLNELEDGKIFDFILIDEDFMDFHNQSETYSIYNNDKMKIICYMSSSQTKKCDNTYFIDKNDKKSWLEIDRILNNTLKNKIFSESLGCYLFKKAKSISRLPLSEITYIEHIKSENIIHMQNGIEYKERKTMSQMEAEINTSVFVRCHRSFFINLMHVQQIIGSNFIMKSGDIIPISKKELSNVREVFLSFCYTDFERMDKFTK